MARTRTSRSARTPKVFEHSTTKCSRSHGSALEFDMATDLFSSLYANIDGKLDLFLNERLQNLVDVVRGPLALGLVIYIALFDYMVISGIISEPWGELFYRMVKLCLLYIAAPSVAYSEWITTTLFPGLPDSISQALAGRTIGTHGQTFDASYSPSEVNIGSIDTTETNVRDN